MLQVSRPLNNCTAGSDRSHVYRQSAEHLGRPRVPSELPGLHFASSSVKGSKCSPMLDQSQPDAAKDTDT